MGMDLIPLNPRAGGWHVNFRGWQFIAECLQLLGADISKMSGSNDGDVIERATAQDWAACLEEALDSGRLKEVKAPDPLYGGTLRDTPSLTAGVPLRQNSDGPWLREAIEFFERSGGFQQY